MLGWIESVDYRILDLVRENIAIPFLDAVMVFITHLGDAGFIWVLAALMLVCFERTRPYGLMVLAATLTAFILGDHVIKPLVGRVRPCNAHPEIAMLIRRPGGFSFPSGHSGSSFAAATVICFSGRKLGAAAVVMAFLIAFSRIYLYVHFPSDILGGMVLGISIGLLFGFTYQNIRKKKHLDT